MTEKLHRLLSLVISLVLLLSAVSVRAVEGDPVAQYGIGDTVTYDSPDAELPALSNPALGWKGPETLYKINACGKEEHTHSLSTCAYRESNPGEKSDFGMNLYFYRGEDPNNPEEYTWIPCTKEEYDKAKHTLMTYVYYVWNCGKEEHTHTDACNEITGYRWTVAKTNLNEHTIFHHIRVNFSGVSNALTDVTDVSLQLTYASGRTATLTRTDDTTDDYGRIYKSIGTNTRYAIISNDTDDTCDWRIVGVNINYTYEGNTYTCTVNTFDGLEAARLSCPDKNVNKNGLDFTIPVTPASKFYYKIVKKYWLDDTLVFSEGEDSSFTTDQSAITVLPDDTAAYDSIEYGLDKAGSTYSEVDLTASQNDPDKAVALILNYRRCTVSHEFVSGTEEKSLPEGVTDQLPESTVLPMGSKTAPARDTFDKVYEYVDGTTVGTWEFSGWDKSEVSVSPGAGFVGKWTYTESKNPENVYSITCKFVSGTEGKSLPQGVMDQLPESVSLPKGTPASEDQTFESVTETDANGKPVGIWQLESWTKAQDGENLVYTGTWKFTALNTYSVTYQFVSGTPNRVLPEEVTRQLPVSGSAEKGTDVTPSQNAFSDVEVKENGVTVGTWSFSGWDKTEIQKVSADVQFAGTWVFTEAQKQKYSYSLTYMGNGGTSGTETSLKDSESVENIYASSVTMTVDANPFTYNRHQFLGWATSLEEAAAGQATLQPGVPLTFTPVSPEKTLYAVWKPVVGYSVTVIPSSMGYDFKDGDLRSFSVTVNGLSKGNYTAEYSTSGGWSHFVLDALEKNDMVTVTEFSPAKSGYHLTVTNAGGAVVTADGANYAQTLTLTEVDVSVSFVNRYTAISEEEQPAEVTPAYPTAPIITDGGTEAEDRANSVAPATGDPITPFFVLFVLMLAGAAAALAVKLKRRGN